jgi:alanine racemase
MQVKARLTQLKTIPPGTGVSYGHRWIAQRLTRLGIVEIGYADGVPRQLSDRLQVIVRGCLIPQIGTITMDRIVIDTTDLKVVAVGDIVTLIGKDGDCQIDANDWARKIGTISWEILCGFKHRLPRIYKD